MNNTQCLNFLKELATVLRFQQLLIKKGLSDKGRYFYSKLLRFYWDFCYKCHHHAFDKNSREGASIE